MSRSCGDCRLCCMVLGVQELEKPKDVWCEHACDAGCAIYQRRPPSCAEFTCLWLMDDHALRETERPDRVGVVLSARLEEIEGIKTAWFLAYVHPRARKQRGLELVARLTHLAPVVVIEGEQRNLLAHPSALADPGHVGRVTRRCAEGPPLAERMVRSLAPGGESDAEGL